MRLTVRAITVKMICTTNSVFHNSLLCPRLHWCRQLESLSEQDFNGLSIPGLINNDENALL